MTAIDDRAAQWGPERIGEPLTEERPLGDGSYRAYWNAVLWDIPGAGVYTLAEASVADRFLKMAPAPPPTGLQEAIDVASYQPRDLTALIASCHPRPTHVVVHLYLGQGFESVDQDHTREQIYSAYANGCSVGGYLFCYPGNDPRESVRRALGVAESAGGFIPPVLWLDVEQSTWGMVNTHWIGAAVDEAIRLGAVPGIYTAQGMWAALGDPHDFAGLPLWNAWWNGRHNLEMIPYGGWTTSLGHQYQGDPLDKNVFAAEVCGEMPSGGGGGTDTRDQIIETAAGYAGTPYGMPPGPGQVDCSSYILEVFADVGLPFPSGVRTAEQERQASRPIDFAAVLPGDLVFFEHTYEPDEPPGPDGHVASHVGISLGAGTLQMWNAVEPVVEQTDISTSYWQARIFDARRPPGL